MTTEPTAGPGPVPPCCPAERPGPSYARWIDVTSGEDRSSRAPSRAPHRRPLAVAVVLIALLAVGGGPAAAQDPTTTTLPIPPPAAFIVVDGDSGAVLAGSNEHVRRPPASISKLMTALVVRSRLEDDTPIHVSPAAAAMPARKLNIQAGQTWRESDLLRAMLLCSCNDVARALAESSGGSVGGFGKLARAEAAALGTVDSPVLQDPSGLDDEFSVGGGNRISAYDMAILARAFLSDATLAAIAVKPSHRWVGPDGIVHEVTNHNRLLGTYPGAIGVKTGYTRRAGSTLVAAARRGDRTVIVVILGSQNIWYHAPQLLDLGFRYQVTSSLPRLPAVPGVPAPTTTTQPVPSTTAAAETDQAATSPVPDREQAGAGGSGSAPIIAPLAVVGLTLAYLLERRRRANKIRAAARARDREAALAAMLNDPPPS